MRVSECFEVKTKGITKAEVDLSQNYMYYLRYGLCYGWGKYIVGGGRKNQDEDHLCVFHIFKTVKTASKQLVIL